MPYDTPYNRMIANQRNRSDRAYSNINAYTNQMSGSARRFDEARVSFPDRDGTTHYDTAQIINPNDSRRMVDYGGGVSYRNMEGCGGVMEGTFRGIGRGEDVRRTYSMGKLPISRDVDIKSLLKKGWKGRGREESEEESGSDEECEEMEGGDLADFAKSHPKLTLGVTNALLQKAVQARQKKGSGSMADLPSLFHRSGSGQNMNLVIHPFESPQEQAVFKNYEMTSGPIGGAEPHKEPPKMTNMPPLNFESLPRPVPHPTIKRPEPSNKKVREQLGNGKRAPSAWVQHCKRFAASKGMMYRDALRSAECKASYHSAKKGGSVIGGPINDPVNKGKITGLGRKKTGSALFAPKGVFALNEKTSNISNPDATDSAMSGGASTEFPQKYMKSTGHKWEGATLGAGRPRKRRGGADKNAAPPPISPLVRKDAIKRKPVKVELPVNATPYVAPNAAPVAAPNIYQDMANATPGLDEDGAVALGMPTGKSKHRRGKGAASDFPIVTPARIRKMRKEGGMLKQQMKSSSFSGGAVPNGYPSNANIMGFGHLPKGEVRAIYVKRIMERHNLPKGEASKLYTKMLKHKEGAGWFDDLWSGVKNAASSVGNFAKNAYDEVKSIGEQIWHQIPKELDRQLPVIAKFISKLGPEFEWVQSAADAYKAIRENGPEIVPKLPPAIQKLIPEFVTNKGKV